MVFMPVTYPMKRPIHCKCERFVDESGNDVRWSLCVWHEDRAQWAARETHLHDPAVCRQCAALPPSAPPAPDPKDEIIARLRRALKVAGHHPHDTDGPADEDSGFPTCSGCDAILTAPPSAPPALDVELLARALAIRYYGFRIDAPAPPAQKREAELIDAEYARPREQDR